MEQRPRYRSYLLRLWQISDGKKRIWRASLESPGSGERRGFADLEAMFDFLRDQTGRAQFPDDDDDDADDAGEDDGG